MTAPVTVTAVADTYARSNQANTNFGSAATIQGCSSGGTVYQPFFRFSVGALPATPVSAKVRLFATDASDHDRAAVPHGERDLDRDRASPGTTGRPPAGAALGAAGEAPLGTVGRVRRHAAS